MDARKLTEAICHTVGDRPGKVSLGVVSDPRFGL